MVTFGLDYGANPVRALVASRSAGAGYGCPVVDYPSEPPGPLLDPRNDCPRQYPGGLTRTADRGRSHTH